VYNEPTFTSERAIAARVTDSVQTETVVGAKTTMIVVKPGMFLPLYSPGSRTPSFFVIYVRASDGTQRYVRSEASVPKNQCISILPADGEAGSAYFGRGEARVSVVEEAECIGIKRSE
jgi:hypothetical protein